MHDHIKCRDVISTRWWFSLNREIHRLIQNSNHFSKFHNVSEIPQFYKCPGEGALAFDIDHPPFVVMMAGPFTNPLAVLFLAMLSGLCCRLYSIICTCLAESKLPSFLVCDNQRCLKLQNTFACFDFFKYLSINNAAFPLARYTSMFSRTDMFSRF